MSFAVAFREGLYLGFLWSFVHSILRDSIASGGHFAFWNLEFGLSDLSELREIQTSLVHENFSSY
jgi:hypothetical protein